MSVNARGAPESACNASCRRASTCMPGSWHSIKQANAPRVRADGWEVARASERHLLAVLATHHVKRQRLVEAPHRLAGKLHQQVNSAARRDDPAAGGLEATPAAADSVAAAAQRQHHVQVACWHGQVGASKLPAFANASRPRPSSRSLGRLALWLHRCLSSSCCCCCSASEAALLLAGSRWCRPRSGALAARRRLGWHLTAG